jgi:hypothetical protein
VRETGLNPRSDDSQSDFLYIPVYIKGSESPSGDMDMMVNLDCALDWIEKYFGDK